MLPWTGQQCQLSWTPARCLHKTAWNFRTRPSHRTGTNVKEQKMLLTRLGRFSLECPQRNSRLHWSGNTNALSDWLIKKKQKTTIQNNTKQNKTKKHSRHFVSQQEIKLKQNVIHYSTFSRFLPGVSLHLIPRMIDSFDCFCPMWRVRLITSVFLEPHSIGNLYL